MTTLAANLHARHKSLSCNELLLFCFNPHEDSELKHDVESELKREPCVNEAHLGVSVKGGIVTLSGHVPSSTEKWVAEMRPGKSNHGFDVASGKYVDLVGAGIIDPTKVVRTALENAGSIPGVLLLTEMALTEVPESKGEHGRHGELSEE